MRRQIAVVVAATLAGAALASPVLAGQPMPMLWQIRDRSVVCGLEKPVPRQPAAVLCAAKGIPHRTSSYGYVELSAHGRARLVQRSFKSFQATGTPTVLVPTAHWAGRGVACSIYNVTTVICGNRSGYGFQISKTKYLLVAPPTSTGSQ